MRSGSLERHRMRKMSTSLSTSLKNKGTISLFRRAKSWSMNREGRFMTLNSVARTTKQWSLLESSDLCPPSVSTGVKLSPKWRLSIPKWTASQGTRSSENAGAFLTSRVDLSMSWWAELIEKGPSIWTNSPRSRKVYFVNTLNSSAPKLKQSLFLNRKWLQDLIRTLPSVPTTRSTRSLRRKIRQSLVHSTLHQIVLMDWALSQT
jgi:hypothetical protein